MTAAPRVLGVIPSRYRSSRFPGKPLADIHGKPLIWWVYQQAANTPELHEVVVATEDQRIADACAALRLPVVMTADNHPTGTDRVGEVARRVEADILVNIQGDEPLVPPEAIAAALRPLVERSGLQVTNLMTRVQRQSDLMDATVPKVVVNAQQEAVFLSRLPVPYPKRPQAVTYYKQVCIYGFRREALAAFCRLPRGPAELAEDIELLRFVEHRIPVLMVDVPQDNIAVDTEADLEMVRQVIAERTPPTGAAVRAHG